MNPRVDEYIENLELDWQRGVVKELRHLVHQADPEIQETLKWGTPTFEHDGIVVWLFCAQEWVHFSFPQGALLDSEHKLFEPTENKAGRTMKIRHKDKIPGNTIVRLIKEAVRNNVSGRRVKFTPAPKKDIILRVDMRFELQAYDLLDEYKKRPYYQQKGYIQWCDAAKREETRVKRINKMIEELQEGSYMPPKTKIG